MTAHIESWTEENTDDFTKVAVRGFTPAVTELIRKILDNPLRRFARSCGDIAYEDERPVCIQAAILRQFVFRRKTQVCTVGGMLAMDPGASPTSLYGVMKRSLDARGGSAAFFSNTACRSSMKMNRLLGVRGKGPESCAIQRLQPIHWIRFAWYMILHVVFKKGNLGGSWQGARNAFGSEFAEFWKRYQESCDGIYSSRTPEELTWAFGGERYVVLKHGDGEMDGYIVLKTDASGNRWTIADWIALGNDEQILEDLLKMAKKFLRRRTHAMLFVTTGYPTFIQPILERHFKFARPLANNECLYRFSDPELAREVETELDTKRSWFFGAYDGDACLF